MGVRCAELLFCTPSRYARSKKEEWILEAARFVQTRGLGRHKILRDAGVIEQTVRFLRSLTLLAAPTHRARAGSRRAG
ncbi:MAG TPA: hypothetical protein VGL03_09230 [Thermoanaerobaculia bacterium]